MSYLSGTRLVFSGQFQADVATINNDVRHYDNQKFEPRFQDGWNLDPGVAMNGWWNPDGSNSFRLVGCQIRSVVLADGTCLTRPQDDKAIGLYVANASEAPAAKLVDLDPQFQSASMIWGLTVRLTDGGMSDDLLVGQFQPTPFQQFAWRQRELNPPNVQRLGASFQTVLTELQWKLNQAMKSPGLEELNRAAASGMLSMVLHTFGYNKNPSSQTFTLGTVVGAIGVASADEPWSFVPGRRFAPTREPFEFGEPASSMDFFTGWVDTARGTVSVDLGGTIPVNAEATGVDLGSDLLQGTLHLAVLKKADRLRNGVAEFVGQGSKVSADDYIALGEIPFRADDWLRTTAGMVTLPLGQARDIIADHPLALIRSSSPGVQDVLCRETVLGYYVRADQFQVRLNPGSQEIPQDTDTAAVTLHVSRWGAPMAGTPIHNTLLAPMEGQGGTGDPNEVNPPKAEIPIIGQPQDVVSFDSTIRTNDKGAASLTIKAKPPYMPRGYLDGQIYFIKYMLELPPGVPANVQQHALDVIAIHVRDAYAIPEQPTWEADILPIFQQFGNLYPIMSKRMIDLASYEDVVKHRDIIDLAFSLDISNPNYMPVTRDLSPAKQKTILNWLRRKALDGTYLLERGSRQGPPSGALVPQPMSPADEATASSPEAVAQSKLFRRLALLKGGKTDR